MQLLLKNLECLKALPILILFLEDLNLRLNLLFSGDRRKLEQDLYSEEERSKIHQFLHSANKNQELMPLRQMKEQLCLHLYLALQNLQTAFSEGLMSQLKYQHLYLHQPQ